MIWNVNYLDEAKKELAELDNSIKGQIIKGIMKVQQNPMADGYGKSLHGSLSGCYKIVFHKIGKRVVYKLKEQNGIMLIVVISARADNEVYSEAEKRISKYKL